MISSTSPEHFIAVVLE